MSAASTASTPLAASPSAPAGALEASGPSRPALLAGVVLLLAPLLVIASLPGVVLPWWEVDPLLSDVVVVGLTPSWTAWLLAVATLGAGVVTVAAGRPSRRWWLMAALAGLGSVPVLWHAWLSPDRTLDHARVGSAWLVAIFAGLSLAHAARHSVVRRAVTAALLGGLLVMTLKGGAQVFIEHPALVESFKAQREQIFAANGWSADSPMARAYERRLMQSEATGWLGLSNVYASLCAAGASAALAMLLARLRATSAGDQATSQIDRPGHDRPGHDRPGHDRPGHDRPGRDWASLALGLAFASGVAGVAMAGGKGGWGVLVVGCALAVALVIIAPRFVTDNRPRRPERVRRLITSSAPILCVLMLGLVGLRALAGDHVGERSILFRAFYVEASARMAIDGVLGRPSPAGADLVPVTGPLGTGPAGFKDAYVVYKDPRQPEDVASPHSVLFDWAACLGPLGLAWGGLGLWWLVRAGRAASDEVLAADAGRHDDAAAGAVPRDAPDDHDAHSAARASCLVAAIATIAAIPHVSIALTPDELLVRVGGLALWCVVSFLVAGASTGQRAALLVGAAVLAAHAQIEQSAHWPASAPLLGVALGLAAGRPASPIATGLPAHARRVGVGLALLAGLVPLGVAVVLGWHAFRAERWESHLRAGVVALGADAPLKDRKAQAWRPTVPTLQAASDELLAANHAASSFSTRREASRLLALASQLSTSPEEQTSLLYRAAWAIVPARGPGAPRRASVRLIEQAAGPADPRAWPAAPSPSALTLGENAHLALVLSTATRWLNDPAILRLAIAHQEVVARQDPSAPLHAIRLMELHLQAGQPALAAQAAREALARDALQDYDRRSRGLTDRQRAIVQRTIDTAQPPKATP
jgi:hypothetical protein